MAKSKEELIYDIENELVDPTTNKITGERVKARLLDMVDAMGTGSGAMEYWSFPNGLPEGANTNTAAMLAVLAKYTMYGTTLITSPAFALMMSAEIESFVGMAFNMDLKIYAGGPGIVTIRETLAIEGVDFAAMGGVQITEEEFNII